MNQPTVCPNCEWNEGFYQVWDNDRKLMHQCDNCFWTSEPFTPPPKEIETEKELEVNQFGGLGYTVYDQYGYPLIHSPTYDDRESAIEALQSDLIRNPGSTVVLWPDYVTVKGEVFK